MKYIPADKLIAEIEKRAKFHDDAIKACTGLNNISITHSAGWKEDTELITLINSLQQEQLKEIDLKREINTLFYDEGWSYPEDIDKDVFARHFYELGRARKEE